MKAVISTTYSDTYLFFLPITTWCWNKLGVDVICFMPRPVLLNDMEKLLLIDKQKTITKGNLMYCYFDAPEHKQATYSQCSRLYGACLCLPDNEQLVVSDIDMAFLSKDYIQDAVPNIIDIYGADLVPDGQFPMCYLSGYVKTWKDIIGCGTYQEKLDELLGGIECENMRGNYWGKDQQTIWELLTKASNETADIDYIEHKRAKPGTQFSTRRYDRDDFYILDRLSPDTIDFHMNRPGYEPQNFEIILKILQYHYPQENFDWLISYTEQYRALL